MCIFLFLSLSYCKFLIKTVKSLDCERKISYYIEIWVPIILLSKFPFWTKNLKIAYLVSRCNLRRRCCSRAKCSTCPSCWTLPSRDSATKSAVASASLWSEPPSYQWSRQPGRSDARLAAAPQLPRSAAPGRTDESIAAHQSGRRTRLVPQSKTRRKTHTYTEREKDARARRVAYLVAF